jgi:hypothetical protein
MEAIEWSLKFGALLFICVAIISGLYILLICARDWLKKK